MEPAEQTPEPRKRRRRAVGPVGSRPAEPVGTWPSSQEDVAPVDDDARLLADVPPHHGGH